MSNAHWTGQAPLLHGQSRLFAGCVWSRHAYAPPLLQLASWLCRTAQSLCNMVACLYQDQRSHAKATVVDFIPFGAFYTRQFICSIRLSVR